MLVLRKKFCRTTFLIKGGGGGGGEPPSLVKDTKLIWVVARCRMSLYHPMIGLIMILETVDIPKQIAFI